MTNENNAKIVKRLADDPALEMSEHELEALLNAELDKPADEIDAALVEEILNAMGLPAPEPERKAANWSVVKAHLPERRARRPFGKTAMRIGAAAAAVIVILFVTFRDAEAFRWTLITKILKPVAQTFGIVMDDQTDITPAETEMPVYSVADAPSSLTAYATLDEVPAAYEGYAVRPSWLPEGYRFMSGSHFSSFDSEIFSMDFAKDEAWFHLSIYIVTNESAVYSYDFERTLDVPIEQTIGQHHVTFYRNAEDSIQSAFWIHENAHYTIAGEISSADVAEFIARME